MHWSGLLRVRPLNRSCGILSTCCGRSSRMLRSLRERSVRLSWSSRVYTCIVSTHFNALTTERASIAGTEGFDDRAALLYIFHGEAPVSQAVGSFVCATTTVVLPWRSFAIASASSMKSQPLEIRIELSEVRAVPSCQRANGAGPNGRATARRRRLSRGS